MNVFIISEFLEANAKFAKLTKEEFFYREFVIPEFCSSDGSEQSAELLVKETWHDGWEYYSYDVCLGDVIVFHLESNRRSLFEDADAHYAEEGE